MDFLRWTASDYLIVTSVREVPGVWVTTVTVLVEPGVLVEEPGVVVVVVFDEPVELPLVFPLVLLPLPELVLEFDAVPALAPDFVLVPELVLVLFDLGGVLVLLVVLVLAEVEALLLPLEFDDAVVLVGVVEVLLVLVVT